jgi:hypothetical protein
MDTLSIGPPHIFFPPREEEAEEEKEVSPRSSSPSWMFDCRRSLERGEEKREREREGFGKEINYTRRRT